jgi:uncharacterized protein (DUF983 family)
MLSAVILVLPPCIRVEVSAQAVSPLKSGLSCRCAACGKGPLFSGYLTLVKNCAVCGHGWAETDTGDGAAVFVIFIVGAVIGGLALWTEMRFAPPVWLHLLLWLPLTLILSFGLLRPLKATLVALIYHNKAGLGVTDDD